MAQEKKSELSNAYELQEPYSLDSTWFCKLPFNPYYGGISHSVDEFCECSIGYSLLKYLTSFDRIPKAGGNYLYYVAFKGYDRRMSRWVDAKSLTKHTVYVHISETEPLTTLVNESHDAALLRSAPRYTKVRNINSIIFSNFQIDCWYYSPFPFTTDILYICQYCLEYHVSRKDFLSHRCVLRHPPGNEIYRSKERDTLISVFEVDGCKEIEYCKNLCLLSKLFLDDKQTQFDNSIFRFYVLVEVSNYGCRFVGYFSREKEPEFEYNLACIMTLPCYQKKGYGRFLISLSYLMSSVEGKTGTPEKPLSDLGRVTYYKYWNDVLMPILLKRKDSITIKELSDMTSITTSDIISLLQSHGILKYCRGEYFLDLSPNILRNIRNVGTSRSESSNYVSFAERSKLHWVGYIKDSSLIEKERRRESHS